MLINRAREGFLRGLLDAALHCSFRSAPDGGPAKHGIAGHPVGDDGTDFHLDRVAPVVRGLDDDAEGIPRARLQHQGRIELKNEYAVLELRQVNDADHGSLEVEHDSAGFAIIIADADAADAAQLQVG